MNFRPGDTVRVIVTAEIVDLSGPLDAAGRRMAQLKYPEESVDTYELTLVERKRSEDPVGTIRQATHRGAPAGQWIKVSDNGWILMSDNGNCSDILNGATLDFSGSPIIGSIPGTKAHIAESL